MVVVIEYTQSLIFFCVKDSHIAVVVTRSKKYATRVPRKRGYYCIWVLCQLVSFISFGGPRVYCIVETDSYDIFRGPVKKIVIKIIT
jgi:hypothetical protein